MGHCSGVGLCLEGGLCSEGGDLLAEYSKCQSAYLNPL